MRWISRNSIEILWKHQHEIKENLARDEKFDVGRCLRASNLRHRLSQFGCVSLTLIVATFNIRIWRFSRNPEREKNMTFNRIKSGEYTRHEIDSKKCMAWRKWKNVVDNTLTRVLLGKLIGMYYKWIFWYDFLIRITIEISRFS